MPTEIPLRLLQGCWGTKQVKCLPGAEQKKPHSHNISALKRIVNLFLVSCQKQCKFWMAIQQHMSITCAQSWVLSGEPDMVFISRLCFPGETASKLLSTLSWVEFLHPLVQFSRSVVSYSLRTHGLQHGRLPCPITSSQSLLKLMPIASVIASNQLILCGPLLLLASIFPSIRIFSNESVLRIRWPQFWSFSISPSSEYSGLISFRMDWFDLLAVQGTLKSLLQHHSSKASVLPPQSYSF